MKFALAPVLLLATACSAVPRGAIPAVEFAPRGNMQSPYFAVFVTGDGGWRKIDIKVSDVLRKAGMPVVGLLANRYFALERTPQETANDLDRLIRDHEAKWERRQVVLVGYSRGADVLPLIINRLPEETKHSIAAVALLGPGLRTSLWLEGPDHYTLQPELERMTGIPLICVYGTQERESLCRIVQPKRGTLVSIRGGHHFGGDYGRIGNAILEALNRRG
jgi:type IV secretory pathway VirJ component